MVSTIVVTEPGVEPGMVSATITPEVERAIGAAFAISTAAV